MSLENGHEQRHRHSDFYSYERLLTDDERAIQHAVRKFMTTEVEPLLLEHWSRATFPVEIMPGLAALGLAGLPYHGYGRGGTAVPSRRHDRDGAGPDRLLGRHVQRCARRTGNGLDLPVRLRRATRIISARDGALRQDRVLPTDRTGGRLRSLGWTADHRATRGRQLGPQRAEEMIGNATFGYLTITGPRTSPTDR